MADTNTDWEPIQTSTLASLPEFPLYSFLSKIQKLPSNPQKPLINHQYGVKDAKDILKAHQTTLDSLKKSAKDPSLSGYTHSCGLPKAREELARFYSPKDLTITAENVILFQGPDMAQNHLMRALCNPGDNFLIPSPSVGLWEETAPGYEFVCKKYRLLPEKQWEVDLDDLESKIDEKTRFIVVVNPSNPCGSVYSEAHLKQILAVAEKHKLPIVADEGLEGMSFEVDKFVNLGHISGDVPVLQMGGLGDQYFAFGWNTSWVILYDRIQVMTKFHKGLQAIMQLMLHAATFVSNVIPDVLDGPHQDYVEKDIIPKVKKNADLVYEGLKKLDKYIEPIRAQGGFSMVAKINFEHFKDIASEEEFAEKLYTEESVLVLPSSIYHWKGGVRIVTCLEDETYPEFLQRFENFCKAHSN